VSFHVCFDGRRKHWISGKMNPNLFGWNLDTQYSRKGWISKYVWVERGHVRIPEKGEFPSLFRWEWGMSGFQEK